MRYGFLTVAALAIVALPLAGCESMGGEKETGGTILGGIAGGLAGAQFGKGSGQTWAASAGVLLGSMLGREIGRSLDKADLAYADAANQRAHQAPLGETINWNNPESGHSGTVTPTRDGYSASGRYCREYQQTITVGGQQESAYGRACQQPDGSWQIVS